MANREGYGLGDRQCVRTAAGNPACLRSGDNVVAVSADAKITDLKFTDHACVAVGAPSVSLVTADEQ
jgi:hypothetical protein